jgi:hypothetical protein
MRFAVPVIGVDTCAITWQAPPQFSARVNDIDTKGDVSEIEVWNLLEPSAGSTPVSFSIDELNYDALSYSNLPVRGELLGVLDLTETLNSTTVEFACPTNVETLTVEMRCQRVACHVSFMQINMALSFGFELVRRTE